jgi:hypothetical protein
MELGPDDIHGSMGFTAEGIPGFGGSPRRIPNEPFHLHASHYWAMIILINISDYLSRSYFLNKVGRSVFVPPFIEKLLMKT